MSLSAAFDAVIGAAHATIEGLAALLSSFAGGTAAAAAIVLFTVAVRLLLSPLSYLQIRNERRRAALAPRLTDLQHKHRDDPATLVSETFALYRANGVGPLSVRITSSRGGRASSNSSLVAGPLGSRRSITWLASRPDTGRSSGVTRSTAEFHSDRRAGSATYAKTSSRDRAMWTVASKWVIVVASALTLAPSPRPP